jgi:hypothetical protein
VPVGRHGLPGIDANIEKSCLELGSVNECRQPGFLYGNLERDGFAEGSAEGSLKIVENGIHAARFWFQALAPGKSKEVANERGPVVRSLYRVVDYFLVFTCAWCKHGQVSCDNGEKVVEVMCYAAGEATDCLESFAVP